MTRYKITIEYDGTGFAGWQFQPDRESIQSCLEKAAGKLAGTICEVTGAGRTDAGVHALAQVAHLDIAKEMSAYNVMHGLNYHLGPITSQVIVTQAEAAADDFHARFHATGREYFYRIINRRARLALDLTRAWHIPEPLNVEAMREGAQRLLGHHDFSTFRSTQCQSKSALKTLDRMDVAKQGEEIHIHVSARSFLHHQVRNMAGALRLVGNGKWSADELNDALEAKDRTQGGETAPAHALYLTRVRYNN